MYNMEEFESRYLCEIKSIYHFISHTCILVCNKYSELNPDCRDLTAFFLLDIKNNLSSCFKLVFVNIIKYQSIYLMLELEYRIRCWRHWFGRVTYPSL